MNRFLGLLAIVGLAIIVNLIVISVLATGIMVCIYLANHIFNTHLELSFFKCFLLAVVIDIVKTIVKD